MMKVLHLLYAGLGGHANVFFSFVKADIRMQTDNEAIFAGVEDIREEYILKCKAGKIQWQYLRKKKGFDIRFNKELIYSIKSSSSSIIFLHGSRFILLAKLGALMSRDKKRIVVRETQANHLKSLYDWLWLAIAMLVADRLIFLTGSFRDEIKRKLPWIYSAGKMSVVNNGIDLEFFRPGLKQPHTHTILGMQSRIVPIKDHPTLLKAIALLHRQYPELLLMLKIAGDGDALHSLQSLTKQLQIEHLVMFTGSLGEREILHFLHSLDIYVHASLGETMSTAIMQAMACKLMIIASDVTGINNMIENNKTGLLVPVRNETALANTIFSVINNPAKANDISAAAFNHAQLSFNNKTMFAKYYLLFENMVNGSTSK